MSLKIDNFFTSGWIFNEDELDIKSKYQMINIAMVLSSFALIYGMTVNFLRETFFLIPVEAFLLCVDFVLFFVLRKRKHYYNIVSNIITFQFTAFFLFLLYTNEPASLKHIWLFTYPIILLYLQDTRFTFYWLGVMAFFLLIAPFQPFIEVSYSLFQVTYIGVVLLIVTTIVFFYKSKTEEAKNFILLQQKMLQDKVDELSAKDKLLDLQSKQAVMGEMISMIAHQWRQPLSTVTLSVSNLQIKKLLGESICSQEVDKTLEEISQTVIYLSETIDDFQTYFHPNKELSDVEIHDVLQKAVNFALPRLKKTSIKIEIHKYTDIYATIYMNELIQVVLNIINNAIDAFDKMQDIQEVNLKAIVENDEYIIICIEDTAGGIRSEDITKIFDPYFSTKGKNGTGLGLYMSNMIIQKQFEGDIRVENVSKGARFSIKIKRTISS